MTKNITIVTLLVLLLAGGGWHYYKTSSLEQRNFTLTWENYGLQKDWKRQWNEDIGRKYVQYSWLAAYRVGGNDIHPDLANSEDWVRQTIAHVNKTFSPTGDEYEANVRSIEWMHDWDDRKTEKVREDFQKERAVVKMRQQYYLAALYELWQGKYSGTDPERNITEILTFFPQNMPREKWGELWFRQITSPGFSDLVDPTLQTPQVAAGTTADLRTLAIKTYGGQFLPGINDPEVCRQKARNYFLKYIVATPAPKEVRASYNKLLVREAGELWEDTLFLGRHEYTKEEWEGWAYNLALYDYLDNVQQTQGRRAYLLETGKYFPYGSYIVRTKETLEMIAQSNELSQPEKEQIFREVNLRIGELVRANAKVGEVCDFKKPYEVGQFKQS